MKDSELRSVALKQFYDRRREGYLGLAVGNMPVLEIQEGVDLGDFLRVCNQLGEYGLIEWKGFSDERGNPMGGVGSISAAGIDVAEGAAKPPLPISPISIDQSTHVQHINISGQHGGVQVAGAHSKQEQHLA